MSTKTTSQSDEKEKNNLPKVVQNLHFEPRLPASYFPEQKIVTVKQTQVKAGAKQHHLSPEHFNNDIAYHASNVFIYLLQSLT